MNDKDHMLAVADGLEVSPASRLCLEAVMCTENVQETRQTYLCWDCVGSRTEGLGKPRGRLEANSASPRVTGGQPESVSL